MRNKRASRLVLQRYHSLAVRCLMPLFVLLSLFEWEIFWLWWFKTRFFYCGWGYWSRSLSLVLSGAKPNRLNRCLSVTDLCNNAPFCDSDLCNISSCFCRKKCNFLSLKCIFFEYIILSACILRATAAIWLPERTSAVSISCEITVGDVTYAIAMRVWRMEKLFFLFFFAMIILWYNLSHKLKKMFVLERCYC